MSFYPFLTKTLRDMGTLRFRCLSPHHNFLFSGWFVSVTKWAFFGPSPFCHPIPLGSRSSPTVWQLQRGGKGGAYAPEAPEQRVWPVPFWHSFLTRPSPPTPPSPSPLRTTTFLWAVGEGEASFSECVVFIEDRILKFLEAISFQNMARLSEYKRIASSRDQEMR